MRRFEVGDDIGDLGEAILRAAGEAAQNRRFEARVHVGHVRGRRRCGLLQPLECRAERRVADEGPDAGHHLVEHHAEGVDVGRRRDRPAFDLLGRHVGRRAGNLARVADRQRHRGALVLRGAAGQAEVGDDDAQLLFRRRRRHQHHVVALEVAVHDARAMSGPESRRHLPQDRQAVGDRESSITPELLGQRLAVEQLHGEEHDLVGRAGPHITGLALSAVEGLVAEDVVNPAHVRMRHLAREVHLALEHRDRALVLGDAREDRLERYAFVQLEILGFVELAHAALRDIADDAEAQGDDVAGLEHGRFRRTCADGGLPGQLVIASIVRRLMAHRPNCRRRVPMRRAADAPGRAPW